MARTAIDDAAGLTAGQLTHKRFDALPATATIASVREWFAASSHRRMAVLIEDGRYVGSLTRGDLDGDLDDNRCASEVAHNQPSIASDAPAHAAYELALATEARRVPVVERDGSLLGIIGVTDDLAAFCGTG